MKEKNDHLLPSLSTPAVMPAIWKRYTKEEVEQCIINNFGIVTLCAATLDANYKQFYQAIDHYDLREVLMDAKKQLVGLAEKAILDCLNSEVATVKLKAAETTLRSLGKTEGWGFEAPIVQTQINVNDKETEIKNIFGV